jgi:hypothetical protein
MSAEALSTRTVTINGHEVTFSLYEDSHDINPAKEYDCYSEADLAAWRDGRWEFVIVKAEMPYGDTTLGGVEYGTMGEGVWIGIDTIIADHGADMLAEILASKVHPKGGEPFGTKVTMWSTNWGTRHALITSSPKPEGEREFLDTEQWGIVLRPDSIGSGGMTYAGVECLTLGWHPEGDPK